MIAHLRRIASLLVGFGILQIGHGLLGSLLGVRGLAAGFDSLQLGVTLSGYAVGYLLGSRWAPWLVRRAGPIRSFAALASAASAGVLAHGILVDAPVWFALRVLNGFCMVGMFIVVESWLNVQVPTSRRGTVFSVYLTVNLLAVSLGQWLLLIPADDPLLLFGLISVLMSIGLIPIALTRQTEPKPPRHLPRLGLGRMMKASPLGTVGTLASGFIVGSFYTLGPVFVVNRGGGTAEVATLMATVLVGGAVSLVPVGRLSDRLDRRRVLVTTLALCAVTPLSMLSVRDSIWTLLLIGTFGATALNIYSLSASNLHDHLPARRVLAATATLQTLYGAASILGPVVTGLAIYLAGPTAFVAVLSGAALVVAIFGLYRLITVPGVPTEKQGEHLPGRSPSLVIAEALLADPTPADEPED